MEQTYEIPDTVDPSELFGVHDANLKKIRDHFQIEVAARGRAIHLAGDDEDVGTAIELLHRAAEIVGKGGNATTVIERALSDDPEPTSTEPLDLGKIARTPGQKLYLNGIAKHDITICIGPAGTGKTYLAVRMAVEALKSGAAKKLILCRPAVEAGESLGFLPGDFHAKVNPYLRPLYDALNSLLDYDQIRRYTDREIIEIVPLAYMRGRTLSDAFIILDEGQNTTSAQMKMFLTRMGDGSKIVITGDITQVDLPQGQLSGLIHAQRVLQRVRGIHWQELTGADIVRHPLVAKIVDAYEDFEGAKKGSGSAGDKLRKRKSR